jgi:hypothetical protein
MAHDFILHCIRISISTLSKYVRENKHKKTIKHIFVLGGTSARYKCPPLPGRRGQGTFVPGRGSTGYKCEAFVPGISHGTNAQPHLYQMVCTSWRPGTNEGYQPIQMSIFPVVFIALLKP